MAAPPDQIIAWLRSPEGEQWSRRQHIGTEPWLPAPRTAFAAAVLDESQDPCGRPPMASYAGSVPA
jgi:hypothetical protein